MLCVARSFVGKWAHDSAVEMSHINSLGDQCIGHAAECAASKGDVKREQRHINAMNSNAINDIGPTGCGHDHNFVSGPLQMASQIMNLHLNAA